MYTKIINKRGYLSFIVIIILIHSLPAFAQPLSFENTFRYGEESRWHTLEPITARYPVEKRIASLLYGRMFHYDKSIKKDSHPGLKPNFLVPDNPLRKSGTTYVLYFKADSPAIPDDFIYTLKLMTHPGTFYKQSYYLYGWGRNPALSNVDSLAQVHFDTPDNLHIKINEAYTLYRANFHLVKKRSLFDYIPKGIEDKIVINNASTGSFIIEDVGESKLMMVKKKNHYNRGIDRAEVIVSTFGNLRDRLRQDKRDENSIDMIPEMNIKEIDAYEDPSISMKYRITTPNSNNFWMIAFNYKHKGDNSPRKLFHNEIFRKYLSLLVNTKEIFANTLQLDEGHGVLLCGPLYKRPGLERLYIGMKFCPNRLKASSRDDMQHDLRRRLMMSGLVKPDKRGLLKIGKQNTPVIFRILFPIFGPMGTELEQIVETLKSKMGDAGIILKAMPARNMPDWQRRLSAGDFDLVLKTEYYDYSFDITHNFQENHPLNVSGAPNDVKADLIRRINNFKKPPSGSDRASALTELNRFLSEKSVAIFMWNLKYKTVYRSVLDTGASGINDIDMFQNIDDWRIRPDISSMRKVFKN